MVKADKSMRKCLMSWESMRKYAKNWDSMKKCAKSWRSVLKAEKTWESVLNAYVLFSVQYKFPFLGGVEVSLRTACCCLKGSHGIYNVRKTFMRLKMWPFLKN
jgi:hypothetical protein